MSQIKLTYCNIDRLFYVYLLENGQEVRSKHFRTRIDADKFINGVIAKKV